MMLVRAAAGSSLTPKWNWNLHLLLFLATWLGRSFLTDVCGVKSRDRDSSLDRCMGLFFLLWFTLPSQIYITLHLTGICENFDCYRLLQWAEHVQLLKTVNRDGRERWLSLCLSLSLITAKFVHILNLDTSFVTVPTLHQSNVLNADKYRYSFWFLNVHVYLPHPTLKS